MATEETRTEEFSAAAPPDPDATGTGETSFADADAPPATPRAAADSAGADSAESPGGDSAKSAGADSGEESAGADSSEAEAQKYLALAQRTQADFENYRKRMARENAAAKDRGVAQVAKELLPALDHLEHALKAAASHPTSSSDPAGGHEDVVKGFALVNDEIVAALGRVGIESFSPQGEPFDPNEHEAMAAHAAEGVESGTVIEVYQRGYRLNGQVLRPARVVVAE